MALPMLVGGTECGPSNPLQNLSKRFDNDRGLQQDFYAGSRAGPSKQGFRSQQSPVPQDQDVTNFFVSKSPAFQPGTNPYEFAEFREALADLQQKQQRALAAGWAADFLLQQNSLPLAVQNPDVKPLTTEHAPPPTSIQGLPSTGWDVNIPRWGMQPMPTFAPQLSVQAQKQLTPSQIDSKAWEKVFEDQELISRPDTESVGQGAKTDQLPHHDDGDELARTAGLLLETVREETNPKFQNSQFMTLMTQIRDRKLVVRGNDIVENDGSTEVRVDVKGKGKAIDPSSSRIGPGVGYNFESLRQAGASQGPHELLPQLEDENDQYFKQENAEFTSFWNQVNSQTGVSEHGMRSSWNQLENDWEVFESQTPDVKPVNAYQFQRNNPFLLGSSSQTRNHSLHSDQGFESVLELEAAVQRDIANAVTWFELGVKQQEAEREHKALQALQRAVDLNPSHLPAWLALAVSYTNNGQRQGTYNAVREWVLRNEQHKATVNEYLTRNPEKEGVSDAEKFDHLAQCLISIVQQDAFGDIDADVQIALAVLFNANEDYEKSQDCFKAALSVRPDDWLLYNRVGATMANSGSADQALDYYYRALELNPMYIRARYNLGISCINLRRYEEAATYIFDALMLQDADGVRDPAGVNEARGITSSVLWESLKTSCFHMQRLDLATLCDRQDLEAFRASFHGN
ncbi:TPR-like protein [Dendrothele bispora CBS 962.96]|uniref:TPR-like protein n=1 Tax=Dendrothele bispora (strain CBS 962.96) TaxID=1314807 RepID=A0A4S8MJR6_DENBC|nr:TPR-like protein [Dendrothele bispora CBS 962.96]